MVSCAGLTLSFHDVHRLSRHFSLWHPSSSTSMIYPSILTNKFSMPSHDVTPFAAPLGKLTRGNGAMGVGEIEAPAHVVTWRWLHVALMDIMISDVLKLMMWWCCLSQVTMATVTMATGWLLLLVMMSMMMTVHTIWPPTSKLQDVSQN